jgi:hypothetical protein
MWYFEGALLELPLEDPNMVLFLVFCSVASQALIVPS